MKAEDIIQSIENPQIKAKVNWVFNGEAGISYTEPSTYVGGGNTVKCEEYIVIYDAPISYKAKVDEMTVEELRANIEILRNSRARSVSIKKAGGLRSSPSNPPDLAFDLALSKLTPEQLKKLQEKLGV